MPRGRPRLYPWDTWLDGERRLLLAGTDFRENVVLESLRQQVYDEARKRGQRVSVERYGDAGLVVHAGRRSASSPRGGRPEAYPWADIFDGGAHELHAGVDFPRGGLESFRLSARRAAARRNIKIRTRAAGKSILIIKAERPAPRPLDEFPPPVLVDDGQDEDSTFEAVDYEWEDANG